MKQNLRVVIANLPRTIGGYCFTNSVGEKICVLNAKLTRERNEETFIHETRHIGDYGELDVNQLEAERHKY